MTLKFIESVCLRDGKILHPDLHQRRADLTTLAHFGRSIRHDLTAVLAKQSLPSAGLHKIRITYGTEILGIDVEPYVRRQVRGIKLVDAPKLDYRYKYADRSRLAALRDGFGDGIEPIIVQDGLITDGLYANICVYDGERWLTPERPLLQGTARAAALRDGEIWPARISAEDVRAGKYAKLKLINCMSLFSEAQEVLAVSAKPHKSPMPRMA